MSLGCGGWMISLTLWDCDANPLLCVWSLGIICGHFKFSTSEIVFFFIGIETGIIKLGFTLVLTCFCANEDVS